MSDRIKELYIRNSKLPKRYVKESALQAYTEQDLRTFRYLKEVRENIVSFVKEGKNLLITSNCTGNGKTTWASKMLLQYINTYAYKCSYKYNTPVLFVNVPQFLTNKKLAMSDPSILEELNELEKCIFTAKIVVFDDIAIKTATDFERELLYTYINYRTDNLLTNIYTCNVTTNILPNVLGGRLTSRVIQYSECVEIIGPDMRGANV